MQRFVPSMGPLSTTAVQRLPGAQLQRMAQIQQQLEEQKRKLVEMQEAARHAGMHTAVYDP